MSFQLRPVLERIDNQHDLMVAALRQAGGAEAETLVDTAGKIADVIFPSERLIVEVKSLTRDRGAMPEVQARLGEMLTRDGKMIVFGHVAVRADQLEPRLAGRVLREIGDRLRKEVRAASKQIAATANELGWSDYGGVLAIVAPPSVMRRDLVGWVVNDTLSGGKYPEVGWLILASTPFLSEEGVRGDSFMSFHGRGASEIPDDLKRRIGKAWAALHGQPWRVVDSDPLLGSPRK